MLGEPFPEREPGVSATTEIKPRVPLPRAHSSSRGHPQDPPAPRAWGTAPTPPCHHHQPARASLGSAPLHRAGPARLASPGVPAAFGGALHCRPPPAVPRTARRLYTRRFTNTSPPHTRQPHGHEPQRQLGNGMCPGGGPGGTTRWGRGRQVGGSGAGVRWGGALLLQLVRLPLRHDGWPVSATPEGFLGGPCARASHLQCPMAGVSAAGPCWCCWVCAWRSRDPFPSSPARGAEPPPPSPLLTSPGCGGLNSHLQLFSNH